MISTVIDVSTRAISFTWFSRHSYNEISAFFLFAIFNVELTKPRRDTRISSEISVVRQFDSFADLVFTASNFRATIQATNTRAIRSRMNSNKSGR